MKGQPGARASSVVTLLCGTALGAGALLAGCGESASSGDPNGHAGESASSGASGRAGAASEHAGGATTAGRAGAGPRGGSGGSLAGTAGANGTQGGRAGSATTTGGMAGTRAGSAGLGGESGTGDNRSGSGGDESVGGGGANGCSALVVTATPETPTVELLVDTSTSMFETLPTTSWSVLYSALMDPTSGVVKPLEDKIRFGFLSYKGHQASSESDPACATMTAVAPALDNYDAINESYVAVGQTYDTDAPRWESPSNYAITYAANLLVSDAADTSPKYILLVTDGDPNTCETVDPQCGQDRAIKATQDAYAAGVGLMVLGVGDAVTQPNTGCSAEALRCGLDHLQDMANAGVGAGVALPPHCDDPTSGDCYAKFESCNNGTLLAAYTADAPNVGTAFAVNMTGPSASSELVSALTALLHGAVSCTFTLNRAPSDPAALTVTVGASVAVFGDANGRVSVPDARHVTLQGDACSAYQGGATLDVREACP